MPRFVKRGLHLGRVPDMRRFTCALVLVPLLVSAFSCALLPTETTVVLSLPRTPSRWEAVWGPAQFRVSWRSADGSGSLEEPVAAGGSVRITVPRLPPVAIRAEAVWSQGGGPSLAPGERLGTAGGMWPAGLGATGGGDARATGGRGERGGCQGRRVVPLTYASGPAAEVAWRLLEAGVDLRRFSFERLLAEIADRLPEDPWSLDVDRVVSAVADGAMRVSYVRPVATREIRIAAPEGIWYPGSPFAAPVPGGSPWPALPVGVTPFYSGDGRRLIVAVDERGRAWQSPGRL